MKSNKISLIVAGCLSLAIGASAFAGDRNIRGLGGKGQAPVRSDAVPASGTVSLGSDVSWASSLGPFTPNPLNGCGNPNNCDNFALTIDPPAGNYTVTIRLDGTTQGEDWDMEAWQGANQVGSSGNAGTPEFIT
ncbi:MAG: hypothetical protein KJO35_06495, partial [Gammaproteobacteria bacterium]|nr:hypothetical protein [Gammaproteobacteria bacterium]